MKRTMTIERIIEAALYSKASALLEEVRKQQAAILLGEQVLNEADPKPKVEKDHNGDPVIPSEKQFNDYFSDMQSKHVQDMLDSAKERWKKAADELDKSETEALQREIKAAQEVLNKTVMEGIFKKPKISFGLPKITPVKKLGSGAPPTTAKSVKSSVAKGITPPKKKGTGTRTVVVPTAGPSKLKQNLGNAINYVVGGMTHYSPLASMITRAITKKTLGT